MPDDDLSLLRRIRAGEHAAFETLYRRHRERCYRHALVQTGGRASIAEEVVQEVFLSLFSGEAAPETHVGAYLLRSTRNRAAKVCARRESHGGQPLLDALAGRLVSEVGPLERLERREDLERVIAALVALPPDTRDVVVLRASEGLAWREVAALTGASVSTVSTRYYTALRRLQAALRSVSSV